MDVGEGLVVFSRKQIFRRQKTIAENRRISDKHGLKWSVAAA